MSEFQPSGLWDDFQEAASKKPPGIAERFFE
jgi:hypothetical protein